MIRRKKRIRKKTSKGKKKKTASTTLALRNSLARWLPPSKNPNSKKKTCSIQTKKTKKTVAALSASAFAALRDDASSPHGSSSRHGGTAAAACSQLRRLPSRVSDDPALPSAVFFFVSLLPLYPVPSPLLLPPSSLSRLPRASYPLHVLQMLLCQQSLRQCCCHKPWLPLEPPG